MNLNEEEDGKDEEGTSNSSTAPLAMVVREAEMDREEVEEGNEREPEEGNEEEVEEGNEEEVEESNEQEDEEGVGRTADSPILPLVREAGMDCGEGRWRR